MHSVQAAQRGRVQVQERCQRRQQPRQAPTSRCKADCQHQDVCSSCPHVPMAPQPSGQTLATPCTPTPYQKQQAPLPGRPSAPERAPRHSVDALAGANAPLCLCCTVGSGSPVRRSRWEPHQHSSAPGAWDCCSLQARSSLCRQSNFARAVSSCLLAATPQRLWRPVTERRPTWGALEGTLG